MWLITPAWLPRAQAHGDLDVRIAELTAQLATNPADAALWLRRADLRREHGEHDDALRDASRAQQLRPDWAAPRLQAARIQFAQNLFSNALSSTEAALRLEPDNADARVIRARCLVQSARTNEAVVELTRLLAGNARALPDLYLERARWQAGCGDFAGAVKGLDEGIRRLGSTPSLVLPAIDYERQKGAYAAALARLDAAGKLIPPAAAAALREDILTAAQKAQPANPR